MTTATIERCKSRNRVDIQCRLPRGHYHLHNYTTTTEEHSFQVLEPFEAICRVCGKPHDQQPTTQQPTPPPEAATPRPWRLQTGFRDANPSLASDTITDGTGKKVCNVKDREQGRLIVRAVNAHDKLVEALRIAETLISADIVRDDAGCLTKVREALKLAKAE